MTTMSFEDMMIQDMWGEKKCQLKPRHIPRVLVSDSRGPEHFFRMGPVLGYGRFGEVFEANDRQTGKKYALKVSRKKNTPGKIEVKVLEREISILGLCKHPNIVQLDWTIETPKYIYLVLEICKEALADIVQRRDSKLTEKEALIVVRQIVSALVYLHSNEIAHRDIKLQNILCNPDPANKPSDLFGSVKLSDFGLAACRGEKGTSHMFLCCCGTPTYMAPEVLARGFYDQKCDIWSLGIVLYLCFVGQAPFPGSKESEIKERIHASKVTLKGDIWETFSKNSKLLLKKMLSVNPEKRYSAEQVFNHPWIKGETPETSPPPPLISETKILRKDPTQIPAFDIRTRCTDPAVYKSLILMNHAEDYK